MNPAEAIKEVLSEDAAPDIQAKNPGILEVPEGKDVDSLPVGHFVDLAKSKGAKAIMTALTNLERWNEKQNPALSKWASGMKDKLRKELGLESVVARAAGIVESVLSGRSVTEVVAGVVNGDARQPVFESFLSPEVERVCDRVMEKYGFNKGSGNRYTRYSYRGGGRVKVFSDSQEEAENLLTLNVFIGSGVSQQGPSGGPVTDAVAICGSPGVVLIQYHTNSKWRTNRVPFNSGWKDEVTYVVKTVSLLDKELRLAIQKIGV